MTVFRVLGDQLVAEDEFAEKGQDLVRAMGAAREGSDTGPSVRLRSGDPFSFAVEPAGGSPPLFKFEPIKFGSPVLIKLHHVYSGKVGTEGGIFDKTGDIAVVSGVKDWSAFKASARALNWVAGKKGKRSHLARPAALQDGTTIIAYQKAIATRQLVISLELAAASREKGVAEVLGAAFTAAAGIPLFLPYAGALLAAGQIVPAVGKLLDGVTGGYSQWSASEELTFGLSGYADADAGFRVIASANSGLEGLRYKDGAGLVDASGTPYAGDQPYAVIGVDGQADSSLENFTPMVTSAEVMKRFHLGEKGLRPIVDDMLELMTIISDVKFREEAEALKKKMVNMSAEEKAKEQVRYDALVKNILKAELKP